MRCSVNSTVKNQGDGSSVATTIHYYISSDPLVDGNDAEIYSTAVPGLSPNATSNYENSLTLENYKGTYWIGACVDSVNGETNTENNCSNIIEVQIRYSHAERMMRFMALQKFFMKTRCNVFKVPMIIDQDKTVVIGPNKAPGIYKCITIVGNNN